MAERFSFNPAVHGAGGFAKVFKGRDNILERDIAVKVLDPLMAQFPESDQERFRREARVLARLSHPSIPAIYDVDFSPGRLLIIFQFIEGPTLAQVLEESGPLPLAEVRNWFLQIASALDHAHALGIVHRDIKPANIIISPSRESAWLVDWGICLTLEEAKRLTKSGWVIGTPGYMSPEQQAGEDVDGLSDVYSLAVTLYEVLAGHTIPIGHYEELSAENEAIPPQVDDLIRQCLLPAAQRVESAKAFASRLAGALRPVRPLSEVLAHGRLHELSAALEDMTPGEFAKLPPGQRALILAKLDDITNAADTALRRAATEMLLLLISRALNIGDEYREIAVPAIAWGFNLSVDVPGRRENLRRELAEAAFAAPADAHQILREEFAKFMSSVALGSQPEWFLHACRQVLQQLMANPVCGEGATALGRILKDVNQASVPVRVLWTVSRPTHAAACIFARTSRGVQWPWRSTSHSAL